MNIPNKLYDVLHADIYHCSSYSVVHQRNTRCVFTRTRADMHQYPGAYPYSNDEYILIKYTFSLAELKLDKW